MTGPGLIVELLHNLGVLIAICAVSGLAVRHTGHHRWGDFLQGLLFGAAAVLSMLAPFEFTPGLQFDARSVALCVCAAFFGPRAAITAVLIAGIYRLSIGGVGTVTGLSVILMSALVGTFWFYRFQATSRIAAFLGLWLLGLAVHVLMLVLMFTLPGSLAWSVLPLITPSVLLAYPLTTAIIGIIVFDQQESLEFTDRLREREEQLQLSLRNTPAAIAILDREMRYLGASDRWFEDYGLPHQEITGRSHYEVFPDLPERWKAVNQRCLEGHSTSCDEDRFERADGRVDWLRWSVVPWHTGAGEVGGIIIFTEVITQRKGAEEALRRSEALLRVAGELARVGGWTVELPSEAFLCSDQVAALYGFPPSHTPRLGDLFSALAPESQASARQSFDACVRSGIPYDLEVELSGTAGRSRWLRCIGRADQDDSGAVIRVQGAVQDISDIKNFEVMVAQGQARFRQLADAIPFTVWTANPDGTIDFMNRDFARYTGMDPDQPPAQYWLETIHPEDRGEVVRVWTESVQSGHPCSAEFRVRRSDGCYRWHRVSGVPAQDDSGTVVKWYGTGADIHDLKENEKALARLASRLQATLESITDAFYTLDRDWRFTYLNPEAERLLQRPRFELIGRVAGEVFRDAAEGEIRARLNEAITSQRAVHFETYYAPLKTWFDVHAYPSEEGLAVYFRDITERVTTQHSLKELSERFQKILDFSPLLITEMTRDGRYLLINRSAAAILGVDVNDALGHVFDALLPEATAREFADRIRTVMESRTPLIVEDAITVAGADRIFSTTLFPLLDDAGQVKSIAGISQDVTAQKRAREERERLESRLRQAQKMEAVGQLAGGVAHDFNNMLSVILGHTEMMLGKITEEDDSYHALEEVQQAALRSAELTRQLLAFASKQTIAPRTLELSDTVSGMLKMLRRLVGEDIRIEWRPGPDPLLVRADPSQIDQILANLTVNARDAIEGHGTLTITTGGVTLDENYVLAHPEYRVGQFVELTVHDTGCGIPADMISRIFEPFFTTKPVGSGTGLGLATVYGIVEQNEGFVIVESTPGEGSTFRVYLPRLEHWERNASAKAADRGTPMGDETILLVEDETALLDLTRRMLEALGYRVLTSASPVAAIELAATYADQIQLLITDVVMPEMNGRTLQQRVLEIQPRIRTLFMSGYDADFVSDKGTLDPGVHFLPKPFKLREMAVKVREALNGPAEP